MDELAGMEEPELFKEWGHPHYECLKSANPWNIPTIGRICNNGTDMCPKPGTLSCSKCKLDMYCSRECQRKFWPTHKRHCAPFVKEPVHEIVSSDPRDGDYFKANADLDRPNIYISIKTMSGQEAAFWSLQERILWHFGLWKARTDVYGVARYTKTIILVKNDKVATEVLEYNKGYFEENINVGWERVKDWFHIIHRKTPEADRQAVLETWSKPESPIRILIISEIDELDFVAPDVENIVVLSNEGPKSVGPRWQRMARMDRQRGFYTQIITLDDPSDEYIKWETAKCHRDMVLEGISDGK